MATKKMIGDLLANEKLDDKNRWHLVLKDSCEWVWSLRIVDDFMSTRADKDESGKDVADCEQC